LNPTANAPRAVVGFGGRGDVISSQVIFPTWVLSRDLTLGGPDTVRGNSGEDILIGGPPAIRSTATSTVSRPSRTP